MVGGNTVHRPYFGTKLIALVLATLASAQSLFSQATVQIEFVKIAPGQFLMGCLPSDLASVPGVIIGGAYDKCPDDELPRHVVRNTKSFEIGKYEVTQAQWESVMGGNPSHFKDPKRPVEQVSWDDVQDFLEKLNARHDGYHYRLPTD
jgi:formylglycine-generating enzyme required for sulfatase activity